MKLELTEKDILLLKMAVSILLVFMAVRFLIMPQMGRIQEGRIQKEELLSTREEMEEAIASIPYLEESIETRLEVLDEASKDYYKVMENREVDEILTGLAVEMGLFPISLSIQEAEPGLPAPYLYGTVSEPTETASENYVLTATADMVLRGTKRDVIRFIDAVEKRESSVQIRSIRISEQEYMDEEWNVITESGVQVTMAVYMCDRDAAGGIEAEGRE